MDITISSDPFAPEPESVTGTLDHRYHRDQDHDARLASVRALLAGEHAKPKRRGKR